MNIKCEQRVLAHSEGKNRPVDITLYYNQLLLSILTFILIGESSGSKMLQYSQCWEISEPLFLKRNEYSKAPLT